MRYVNSLVSRVERASLLLAAGVLLGVGAKGRDLLRGSISDLDSMSRLVELPGMLFDLLTFENDRNRRHQNESVSKLGQQDASTTEKLRAQYKTLSKEMRRRVQYINYSYEFQNVLAQDSS